MVPAKSRTARRPSGGLRPPSQKRATYFLPLNSWILTVSRYHFIVICMKQPLQKINPILHFRIDFTIAARTWLLVYLMHPLAIVRVVRPMVTNPMLSPPDINTIESNKGVGSIKSMDIWNWTKVNKKSAMWNKLYQLVHKQFELSCINQVINGIIAKQPSLDCFGGQSRACRSRVPGPVEPWWRPTGGLKTPSPELFQNTIYIHPVRYEFQVLVAVRNTFSFQDPVFFMI